MSIDALALYGVTPQGVAAAQTQLDEWLGRKILALGEEHGEYEANRKLAKQRKWRWQGFARAASLCRARIEYYAKMQAAVRSGYLLIPNFPIDVFAIRKAEGSPVASVTASFHGRQPEQQPDRLALGQGDYVSNEASEAVRVRPKLNDKYEAIKDAKGNVVYEEVWEARELQAVALPVVGVKPQVVEALDTAMQQRIFDVFGLVGPRKQRDPIIVGRIFDPRGRYHERFVTFFIGWWLNVEDL